MRIDNTKLKDFLVDNNAIDQQKLEEIFQRAEKEKKSLGDILLKEQLIKEEQLKKVYAYILGIPYVDLSKKVIPPDILRVIPENLAKKYKVIAFERSGGSLKVAMLDPEDILTIDFIKKKTGLKVVPCITSDEGLDNVLRQYEKSLKAEFGDIIGEEDKLESLSESVSEESEEELEEIAKGLPIIRIVDTLLKHAILQDASDIHIEPDEKEVRVRYRIDGILREAMKLPKEVMPGIVARIKVLTNLKLDEHRLPQDGRFKIVQEGRKISFRVSILPVFDGEKIVMRLLDESSKGLTLESIGLYTEGLEIFYRQIKKPNGMILVTGPTGSGKTTTLYTVLDILNTPKVNISTVEDPVEYRMSKINQTQVHAKIGMTFAIGLRSLLRQDPDIIMVGEIRDKETMDIAIHSAMTGHLVLSTLHTNSAAGALPRLIDMGAEGFLIASTVNVVVGQRLVRRLCVDCGKKNKYKLRPKEIDSLRKNFDIETILKNLKKLKDMKGLIKEDTQWEDIEFYKTKGCKTCSDEGYKGRTGIYEVLECTDSMKKLITESSPTEVLEKQARAEGMITMTENGFMKAVQGITTIEEILRVTKE